MRSAVSIPVVGDGEVGSGDVDSLKRTVTGHAWAGFAGIVVEDQAFQKSGGRSPGKVVPAVLALSVPAGIIPLLFDVSPALP